MDGAYWIKREANSVVYGFGNWQEYAKAESTQALCEDNGDFDVSSWQKNYPLVRFFAIAEGNYRCVFDGYYRSAACCEQKFIPHTLDVPEEFVLEYGYSWLYPHGYVLLTDYTGDADVVRIPEGVSDISEFVGNRKSMSALIFPEGCRSTGYESFMDCPDLTEVVLPEGIHVGNGSFSHCPKLTHITLPLGTTLDSEGCLYGCITDYTLTLKTGEVFDFRSVYSSDEEWVSDRPDVLTVSLVREEFIANQPGTAKVTGYHSWYDRTGKETKFLLNWHITVIE